MKVLVICWLNIWWVFTGKSRYAMGKTLNKICEITMSVVKRKSDESAKMSMKYHGVFIWRVS